MRVEFPLSNQPAFKTNTQLWLSRTGFQMIFFYIINVFTGSYIWVVCPWSARMEEFDGDGCFSELGVGVPGPKGWKSSRRPCLISAGIDEKQKWMKGFGRSLSVLFQIKNYQPKLGTLEKEIYLINNLLLVRIFQTASSPKFRQCFLVLFFHCNIDTSLLIINNTWIISIIS